MNSESEGRNWVCDKCKTMKFRDYNEACEHEAQCDGSVPPAAAAAAPAVNVPDGGSQVNPWQIAFQSVEASGMSHDETSNNRIFGGVESAMKNADVVNKKPLSQQKTNISDEWANNLVGRWWEVYWDPDGGSDKPENTDDLEEKIPAQSTNDSVPVALTAPIEEQQSNTNSIASAPQRSELEPHIQKINALYTSARLGLSLQQMHFPTTANIDPPVLSTLERYRQLQNQQQQQSYIIVKNILPDAPNGNLLQANDIITGINGNSFYSPEFQANVGGGGDFFNRVVGQLKDAKRPMIVNFDRVAQVVDDKIADAGLNAMQDAFMKQASERDLSFDPEPVPDFPPGWVQRRIPRSSVNHKASDVYYFSPVMGHKFRSRPEVARFLECIHQANGDEEMAIVFFRDDAGLRRQNSDIDDVPLTELHQNAHNKKRHHHCESDEEECEDAIDWYDAKILCYSEGEFEVYFLGDDEGTTYKMPLTPDNIRPSVRAWATRSRALMDYDLDLSTGDDYESWVKRFRSSLPPSTDFYGDGETFAASYNDETNEASSTSAADGHRMLQEVKRMISMQLHLAKQISPADDGPEGDEDEEDQLNGPGPAVSSIEVKLMCRYLTEAVDACKWMLSEHLVWVILRHLSISNSTSEGNGLDPKITREALLSFLVNGLRVLYRLLQAGSEFRTKDVSSGKKKRRIDSNTITISETFDQMLRNALLSDEALSTALDYAEVKYSEKQRTKFDSVMHHLISQATTSVWKPLAEWINTADDIVGDQSRHSYSIDDIERHALDVETSTALGLIDLSSWTVKLEATLSRANFFEMELWSAIKACTQLNISRDSITSTETVNVGGCNDPCFAVLQRLKREASVHPMKNINPLGKALVTSEGVRIPSSLTRSAINDAVTVRLWVLDLMQAKLVRERSSFVEGVIRGFSTLPKLPSPPFSGFDGAPTQPSQILVENTKDSITILSANCYSYNHIIGNIGASLRDSASTIANDSTLQDIHLKMKTKSGVASALVELRRLPILSVVEEKLCVREEFIDWNARAQEVIDTSASCKVPYTIIEELHNDLVNIVEIKSEARMKVCQNLRPNKSVDSEVRLFAIDDVQVICSKSAAWVRYEYNNASDWKKRCDSILQALESHGFFSEGRTPVGKVGGNNVDVGTIESVWEQYTKFASLLPECERLAQVKKRIQSWISTFDQALLSNSLSLQERCAQLSCLNQSRPKGVVVKPSPESVSLWLRVFSWPQHVEEGISRLTEQYMAWKASNHSASTESRDTQLIELLKTHLGPIIVEGQIFLLKGELPSSMICLKEEAIKFVCGNEMNTTPIRMNTLVESTCQASTGLNHIFNMKEDVGPGLLVLRTIFWKIMVKCFLQHIHNVVLDPNATVHELVNLHNSKILHSLCPRNSNVDSAIIQDRTDEERLHTIIRDADELNSRASAILSHSSDLLQTGCFMRKNELKICFDGLTSLRLAFANNRSESLLLQSTNVEDKVVQKIDSMKWLLSTMPHPILWSTKEPRIPLAVLTELCTSIPIKLLHIKTELAVVDAEAIRMVSLVRNLVDAAKSWQESFHTLQMNKIVELCSLKAISQASILLMVVMPDEEVAHDIFEKARLMKESLESKLLSDVYNGSKDVYKSKFPDEESLVADNGDFLLLRLTGSEIYSELKRLLKEMKYVSDQLIVTTAEKATYLWILDIYRWVKALNAVVNCGRNSKLVITVESAGRLLEQGHDVLYSIADEVKDVLALKQVSIRATADKFSVVIMKGGAINSPGGSFLRWAALLFCGLKADVEKAGIWKEQAEKSINSYSLYEQGTRKISPYVDKVRSLIDEANDNLVQDDNLVRLLSLIVNNVMTTETLKKRLDDELAADEEERFHNEMTTYEGPPLVDERYNLLDSLIFRSCAVKENEPCANPNKDDSLFAGEQSSRDKSRHFLQKSLFQGLETYGIQNHEDANDFCNVLAWDLEQAIFDKFKPGPGESVSSEYREKVRCLRFNLQDPKNPMLCARVLSGHLKIHDLIVMTSEELASKELNLYRRQVQEEARKQVVLSVPTAIASENQDSVSSVITSDFAKKIKMESPTKGRAVRDEAGQQEELSSAPQSYNPPQARAETHHQWSPAPPPPFSSSKLEPLTYSFDEPEDSSDLPPPRILSSSTSIARSSHFGRHITAKDGTDSFVITVPRLKLSFTTKLYIEQSCPYQMDSFLPSSLTEKGRITLDEFNKFISEKMKGGRWNIAHLKLSSIGEADMSSYKRLYKEYESLDRICMINVTDSTKVFLVTPKFLRVAKCLSGVHSISRSSSYAVVLTKDKL